MNIDKLDTARELFEIGLISFESGNFSSLAILKQWAHDASPEYQYRFALNLLSGFYENRTLAEQLLRAAARRGHHEAANSLRELGLHHADAPLIRSTPR